MSSKNILQKIFLHKDNRWLAVACLLLSFSFLSIYNVVAAPPSAEALQKGIASEIIRFHVIANSDSTEDQTLKIKIKEAVTAYLEPLLKDTDSTTQARELLNNQLPYLKDLADSIIFENGFTYTSRASISNDYFPLKVYGDLSLPPGDYEALRIELGEAKGQNWWCIMFPPLCFIDATYSVVPKESKNQLKHFLTEDEYTSILSKDKPKVKVKFKLFSVVKDFLAD
jgi:stage II sporulation protein R